MSLRLTTSVIAAMLLSIAVRAPVYGQAVNSLDDIDFWIGGGANRVAIAIDWNGESSADESYVWGYRWNDSTGGIEMLVDVISADERLYAKLGAVAGLGTAVVGIGYDQNDDGQFTLTDDSPFDERGINAGTLSDGETSTDPADFYAEGWFLGFWHMGLAIDNPFDGGTWLSATTGLDGLVLADNLWISLAFTTDTMSTNAFAENLVAASTPLFADFDTDDDVDGADFLAWQRGFGIVSGALLEQGDANGDGAVDQLDLQLWSSAFGEPIAASAARSVPEPSSLILVFSVLFLFLGTRLFGWGRPPRRCF